MAPNQGGSGNNSDPPDRRGGGGRRSPADGGGGAGSGHLGSNGGRGSSRPPSCGDDDEDDDKDGGDGRRDSNGRPPPPPPCPGASSADEPVMIEFPVKQFWKVAKQQNDIESSDVGHCRGFYYRLLIHPKGTAGTDSEASHLSVFLEAVRQDWFPDDWVFPNVRFELTVVNFRDAKQSVTSWAHWSFSNEATSRGWQKMLSHSRLSRLSGFVDDEGTVLIRGKAEPPYAQLWSRAPLYRPRQLWSLMPQQPVPGGSGTTAAAPAPTNSNTNNPTGGALDAPPSPPAASSLFGTLIGLGTPTVRDAQSVLRICQQVVPSIRTALHADFVSCFIIILYHLREFRREVFLWNTLLHPCNLYLDQAPSSPTADHSKRKDTASNETSQTVIEALQTTFAHMQLWPLAAVAMKASLDGPQMSAGFTGTSSVSGGDCTAVNTLHQLSSQFASLGLSPPPGAASPALTNAIDWLRAQLEGVSAAASLPDGKSATKQQQTPGVMYAHAHQPSAKNVMKSLCMHDVQKMDVLDPLPHIHADLFSMIHRECQITYVSYVYKQALLDAKRQATPSRGTNGEDHHRGLEDESSCNAQEMDHALRLMFSTVATGSAREPLSVGDYATCFLRAKHVHSMYRALEQSGKRLKRFPEVLFVYLSQQRNTKKGELFDVPLRLEISNLMETDAWPAGGGGSTAANDASHPDDLPPAATASSSEAPPKGTNGDYGGSLTRRAAAGDGDERPPVKREKQRKRLRKKQSRVMRSRRTGGGVCLTDDDSGADDETDDGRGGRSRDWSHHREGAPVPDGTPPAAAGDTPSLSSRPDKWYCLFAVVIREGDMGGVGGGSQTTHTLLLRPEEDGPWLRIAHNRVEVLTPHVDFSEWKCHRDFFCAAAVYIAEDYIDAIANGEVDLEGDLRDLNPDLYERTLAQLGVTEDQILSYLRNSSSDVGSVPAAAPQATTNAARPYVGATPTAKGGSGATAAAKQVRTTGGAPPAKRSESSSPTRHTNGAPVVHTTDTLKFQPRETASPQLPPAAVSSSSCSVKQRAIPPDPFLAFPAHPTPGSRFFQPPPSSAPPPFVSPLLEFPEFSSSSDPRSCGWDPAASPSPSHDHQQHQPYWQWVSPPPPIPSPGGPGAAAIRWQQQQQRLPPAISHQSVLHMRSFSLSRAHTGTLSAYKAGLLLHHHIYQARVAESIRYPDLPQLKQVLAEMVGDRLALVCFDPTASIVSPSTGDHHDARTTRPLRFRPPSYSDLRPLLSGRRARQSTTSYRRHRRGNDQRRSIGTTSTSAAAAADACQQQAHSSLLSSSGFFPSVPCWIQPFSSPWRPWCPPSPGASDKRVVATASDAPAAAMLNLPPAPCEGQQLSPSSKRGSQQRSGRGRQQQQQQQQQQQWFTAQTLATRYLRTRAQSEDHILAKGSVLRVADTIANKILTQLDADITTLAELLVDIHKDVNTYCVLHRSRSLKEPSATAGSHHLPFPLQPPPPSILTSSSSSRRPPNPTNPSHIGTPCPAGDDDGSMDHHHPKKNGVRVPPSSSSSDVDLYVDIWLERIWMTAAVLVHKTKEVVGDLEELRTVQLLTAPDEDVSKGGGLIGGGTTTAGDAHASSAAAAGAASRPPLAPGPVTAQGVFLQDLCSYLGDVRGSSTESEWFAAALAAEEEYAMGLEHGVLCHPEQSYYPPDTMALRYPRLAIPDIVCSAVACVVEARSVAEWLFLSSSGSALAGQPRGAPSRGLDSINTRLLPAARTGSPLPYGLAQFEAPGPADLAALWAPPSTLLTSSDTDHLGARRTTDNATDHRGAPPPGSASSPFATPVSAVGSASTGGSGGGAGPLIAVGDGRSSTGVSSMLPPQTASTAGALRLHQHESPAATASRGGAPTAAPQVGQGKRRRSENDRCCPTSTEERAAPTSAAAPLFQERKHQQIRPDSVSPTARHSTVVATPSRGGVCALRDPAADPTLDAATRLVAAKCFGQELHPEETSFFVDQDLAHSVAPEGRDTMAYRPFPTGSCVCCGIQISSVQLLRRSFNVHVSRVSGRHQVQLYFQQQRQQRQIPPRL